MKIIEPRVEFLYPSSPEEWIKECKLIELAARNCYKSEDKITDDSWKKFVKMLVTKHHDAMIEFGNFVVRIITDRGITHETIRHRLASYAQESTRWINYSKEKFGKEISTILPSEIKTGTKGFDIWQKAMTAAEEAYFALLEEKYTPQTARSVLPTCTKTDIIMKCNFRELIHIIKMRTSEAAHPDIIIVFSEIRKRCKEMLPEIFE